VSNVVPVFPNGFFTWVDRVDQVNVDFANDINSVASDLISVETILGTNPQIEPSPPGGGTPLTYATVSNRISDAMSNAQLPGCVLSMRKVTLSNTAVAIANNYTANYDPYHMFNGTDITIPVSGWWIITNAQRWDWWGDGYVHQTLTVNGQGNILAEDIIDWAFSGNVVDVDLDNETPRWQVFGLRPRISNVVWQGILTAGSRISVFSENGTSNTSFGIDDAILSAACLRTLPSSITGIPTTV
jgi:hypothetical protein